MSNKIHNWNVIIKNSYGYPMKPPIEFHVKSKTQLGASMKARSVLKKYHSKDWHISSVYWLDPKYLKDE